MDNPKLGPNSKKKGCPGAKREAHKSAKWHLRLNSTRPWGGSSHWVEEIMVCKKDTRHCETIIIGTIANCSAPRYFKTHHRQFTVACHHRFITRQIFDKKEIFRSYNTHPKLKKWLCSMCICLCLCPAQKKTNIWFQIFQVSHSSYSGKRNMHWNCMIPYTVHRGVLQTC